MTRRALINKLKDHAGKVETASVVRQISQIMDELSAESVNGHTFKELTLNDLFADAVDVSKKSES